jgi:hypothetical protein
LKQELKVIHNRAEFNQYRHSSTAAAVAAGKSDFQMMSRELPSNCLERYSTRRVVFAHPFTLGRAPEVYAEGAYDVETREQAIDAGAHTAHVRTSTTLIIPTATGICCREVAGSDLDEALSRDAGEGEASTEVSENPDRGKSDENLAVKVLP